MDVLDALRGAALLGILLINVGPLSGLTLLPPGREEMLPLAAWHEPVHFLLSFLIESKFYSLFSFLFGVGFAVFVQRASSRGGDAARLFKRRLTGLLLVGLVHTSLIWMGDILVTYALLGFALVPFIRRDDRTVLRWAGALLLLPILLYGLLMVAMSLVPAAPQAAPGGDTLPPVLREAVDRFATGGYAGVVMGNVAFTAAQMVRRFLLMFFPRVMGMFLLGFYTGRRQIFADLGAHRLLLWRVLGWGTVIGVPLSLAGALLDGHSMGRPGMLGLIETTVKSFGIPALSLAYAAGFCLLFARAPRLRRAFAPVGQMALTHYLLHSVAGVAIFYGIGLGLFGRVPIVIVLAGAVGFFGLQMIASRFWLARARFGPVEWMWRVFTYGHRVPLFTRPGGEWT